jgi:hypothetical protein
MALVLKVLRPAAGDVRSIGAPVVAQTVMKKLVVFDRAFVGADSVRV